MKSHRWTARGVGLLFLAAFLTYGIGSGFVESIVGSEDALREVAENEQLIRGAALLMLLNSAIVVGIGILLVPILREHNPVVAYGYLSARIIEAALLGGGVLGVLALVPISQGYVDAGAPASSHHRTLFDVAVYSNDAAFWTGMIALGFGSLLLTYSLYRTQLVPRWLAAWGFTGYAIFTLGGLLEILGVGVGAYLLIPGGLWEVAFGLWLVVWGFDGSASVFDPVDTPRAEG